MEGPCDLEALEHQGIIERDDSVPNVWNWRLVPQKGQSHLRLAQ